MPVNSTLVVVPDPTTGEIRLKLNVVDSGGGSGAVTAKAKIEVRGDAFDYVGVDPAADVVSQGGIHAIWNCHYFPDDAEYVTLIVKCKAGSSGDYNAKGTGWKVGSDCGVIGLEPPSVATQPVTCPIPAR